jgi:DHA1 family inner membrane transport protein
MRKLPLAIWAMVVGAFAMGADEFIVAGAAATAASGCGRWAGWRSPASGC